MTQYEIIAMAREACGPESEDPVQDGERLILSFSEMDRFASLVAAKEREACAQALENLVADHVAGTRKSKNKLDWCAAEDRSCEYVDAWSVGAAAIRARSTT